MELGPPPRPPLCGGSALPAAASAGPDDAVPADLPPARSVQSADAGHPVRVDLRGHPSRARDGEAAATFPAQDREARRRYRIEPVTGTLVLERIDGETGETIAQVPDEALLELRILMRELVARLQEDAGGPAIERIA